MGVMSVSKSNFRVGKASVDGATADTDIAVTGILTTDTLLDVTEVTTTTAALVDRTATSSITEDGVIQCTDATDGDALIVFWVGND